MSLNYSNQIEEIRKIIKRDLDGTCVECGSEIEEIDNPELTTEQLKRYKQMKYPGAKTFKCKKCGFVYCSNWRHEYIKAIENIVKKNYLYQITFDFSRFITHELQGGYKNSTDKFLDILEGQNRLRLRFTKDQWYFLAGMFIDALSEEEKQGIAEMSFDRIILT